MEGHRGRAVGAKRSLTVASRIVQLVLTRVLRTGHDEGGEGGAGGFDSQDGGGETDAVEVSLGGGGLEEGEFGIGPAAFGADEGGEVGGI